MILPECSNLISSDNRSHVIQAAQRLVNLDDKQVDAVATRIELDLRIGYAFTRFMTNNLRPLGGPMGDIMLSYGTFRSVLYRYVELT